MKLGWPLAAMEIVGYGREEAHGCLGRGGLAKWRLSVSD